MGWEKNPGAEFGGKNNKEYISGGNCGPITGTVTGTRGKQKKERTVPTRFGRSQEGPHSPFG